MSNLVSALLVSSNPTNLVLTSAFGISFLSYSAWLAVPTIAGAIVLFPILRWVVFRGGMIPSTVRPPSVDPKSALVDPWGGAFGAGLFVVTIASLVGLSAGGKLEGVEGVWTITAPAAVVMFLRDCAHDLSNHAEAPRGSREIGRKADLELETVGPSKPATDGEAGNMREPNDATSSNGTSQANGRAGATAVADDDSKPAETLNGAAGCELSGHTTGDAARTDVADAPTTKISADLQSDTTPATTPDQHPGEGASPSPAVRPNPFQMVITTLPTPWLIITRLPLRLIPFAFAMFILVEALSYTGWIRVFGGWWAAWANVGGLAGCVWLMGVIGVLGCNVGVRIGAITHRRCWERT